jgi:hypothetical protein
MDPELHPLIRTIRGQRVVLDADLARIYGVATKRFNEAFKRNRRRFPVDFAFQLTPAESANLRSQIATSSLEEPEASPPRTGAAEVPAHVHGGRRSLPWAFSEHGALMVANVLRSSRAIEMSVFVVRAFVHLRREVVEQRALLQRLTEIDETLIQHDAALEDVYRKLSPLLQPSAEPSRRRIGFHPVDRTRVPGA